MGNNFEPQDGASRRDEILDDEGAAKFFGIETRTLRLWRRTRGLPHFKITSKVIRYRRSDLEAWMALRRVAIVA